MNVPQRSTAFDEQRALLASPTPLQNHMARSCHEAHIREAAEKGYDKVAWTPGSVQADRYDLSKQISKVSYVNKLSECLGS
jgi:hypothetical protein